MKSKKTLKSIAFCLVWIFLLSAAALPAVDDGAVAEG